jgi:intracellular multiplication protein IcmG
MDNEIPKRDTSEEEEYHFSPEATPVMVEAASSAKKNILENIKRKNIFLAIGVLAVAFTIYKLFDILLTTNGAPPRGAVTATTFPATAPTPAITPVLSASPVVQQAGQGVGEAKALNNNLSDINKRQAEYKAGLDKLTDKVNEMQNALAMLGPQLSSLNSSVQSLATQFAAQQAQLATEKQALQQKVAKKKIRAIPKPVYFVRAMVPGRAWLATKDGGTITMSVGNTLPGYGTVESIDPVQGIITTDSGAIIGFSPADS